MMTIAGAVVEYLDADGGWLHIELVIDEVQARYPHMKNRDSIKRTIHKLIDKGAIESRVDTHLNVWGRVQQNRLKLAEHAFELVNVYETRGRKKTA